MAKTTDKPVSKGALPFPEDLQGWLLDRWNAAQQGDAKATARLVPHGAGKIMVGSNGELAAEAPEAVWDGPEDAPLWSGYPFAPYSSAGDTKEIVMLDVPRLVGVAGIDLWKVADHPASHCGVYLRADVYGEGK